MSCMIRPREVDDVHAMAVAMPATVEAAVPWSSTRRSEPGSQGLCQAPRARRARAGDERPPLKIKVSAVRVRFSPSSRRDRRQGLATSLLARYRDEAGSERFPGSRSSHHVRQVP